MTTLPIEFEKTPDQIVLAKTSVDQFLEKVDETINGFVTDLSTKKGRDEIASNAYKMSRSKTAISEAGKKQTEEWRKKTKEVNEVIKYAEAELDKRRDQVRKPLNDWEAEQAALEARRQSEFQRLVDLGCVSFGETSSQIKRRIEAAEAFDLGDWWGQMLERVKSEQATALERLNNHFLQAEAAEKQAAEMAELKRKQAEDEARRIAAEEKAKAEQEARERAEREAIEAAARKEREAKEAEERKVLEAKRAKEAEERRARELAEAEERARQAEKARLEAEQLRKEQEEAKRRADAEHHDKVISDAVKAITDNTGCSTIQAAKIVELIEAGRVPRVSIKF